MLLTEAKAVWKLAHWRWPEDAVFRYFARHPDGRVQGSAIKSPEQLARTCTWADADGWNSYWQVNPTKKTWGVRCSAEDIIAWAYLCIDIDPILPKMSDSRPEDVVGLVTRKLLEYWPELDTLSFHRIYSGRGYQMLIPVYDRRGLDRYPGKRARVARLMGYWLTRLSTDLGTVEGCVVDTSCSDLARVMRMPYTINQKTGLLAYTTNSTRDNNYVLFDAMLFNAPTAVLVSPPPIVQTDAPYHALLPCLTRAARMFIRHGKEEPGRHHQAAAAMLSLQERGATYEQCHAAVSLGAARCKPPLPQTHVDDMVARRYKVPRHALT